MGNFVLDSVKEDIESAKRIASDSIDLWLKDQDLFLNERKKHKLSLLLVRYFSEKGGITQERAMNLLGNLGGGHFDFDNTDSVEIEIQRLLGHTSELTPEDDRRFYRKAIQVALIGTLMTAFSVTLIMVAQYVYSKPDVAIGDQKVDPDEIRELEQQIDNVMKLREEKGVKTYSHKETFRILGGPLGITNPETMTKRQYVQMRTLLQNIKIELLKQKTESR